MQDVFILVKFTMSQEFTSCSVGVYLKRVLP